MILNVRGELGGPLESTLARFGSIWNPFVWSLRSRQGLWEKKLDVCGLVYVSFAKHVQLMWRSTAEHSTGEQSTAKQSPDPSKVQKMPYENTLSPAINIHATLQARFRRNSPPLNALSVLMLR